jgi:dTMP kinase
MDRGYFISFEGPEGSGKSTAIGWTQDYLQGKGYEVVTTREPGGTPTGEAIREILQHDSTGEPLSTKVNLLLFAASRSNLIEKIVIPNLEQGKIVLVDRFADSTTAYQGYGGDYDLNRVRDLHKIAVEQCWPDLTFLLDLPVEVGLDRIRKRPNHKPDTFESKKIEFHRRVRQGYLEIAKDNPDRVKVINAELNPRDVQEEIRKELHYRRIVRMD